MSNTRQGQPINLRLPFPISANGYWSSRIGTNREGKPCVFTYVTKKASEYRAKVVAVVLDTWKQPPQLTERLRFSMWLTAPDRRKRDVGNYHKVLEDALEYGCVFQNDSQIDELHVYRNGIEKPGWVDVRIEVIDETQQS